MSEKKVNIIIITIVFLSIITAFLLMYFSPKKNNIDVVDIDKEVDKIEIINNEIDSNINNNLNMFTLTLSNYKLSDKTINLDINVRKNINNTFKIDKIVMDNNNVIFNSNEEIIDFNVGIIKENNDDKFIYIVTITGSQDGEGDVIILNNSGNILYQNQKAFFEVLDDEKYLIKEKYSDVLTTLTCEDNNINAIAFKNITYKSINGQLVNINYEELKIGDICY